MENPIFFEDGSTTREEYAKAYRHVQKEGIVAREAEFIISILQTLNAEYFSRTASR